MQASIHFLSKDTIPHLTISNEMMPLEEFLDKTNLYLKNSLFQHV